VFVPAGGRIVLNVAIGGVFPFTAVGTDYVSVGSFYGGGWVPPDGWYGPPPDDWHPYQPVTYQDVNVWVPSVQRTVRVNKVVYIGHDDHRPIGQQDAYMLDDSTMAWGQTRDGRDGGTIDVTQTQGLPGVGPVTDAGQWVNTTLASASQPSGINWLDWGLGAALAAVVLLASGVTTWLIKHPRRARA
jgi:hypothetical protein